MSPVLGTSVRSPKMKALSPKEIGVAAVRGFIAMAEAWDLSVAEQLVLLGRPSRSTFIGWKKDPAVVISQDTLERISYLLGIWKALRILIPDDRQALYWIRKPNLNPLFQGRPPLERMLQGRIIDLADVRRLLDARQGVW